MKSKKELREEYKLMKFPAGVYQIRNTINGKVFIASTNDLTTIWNGNKFKLEMGGFVNENLQREWKEFGKESFVFEIIEELKESDNPNHDQKKELKGLEDLIMEELQPYGDKGYNKKKVN